MFMAADEDEEENVMPELFVRFKKQLSKLSMEAALPVTATTAPALVCRRILAIVTVPAEDRVHVPRITTIPDALLSWLPPKAVKLTPAFNVRLSL